MSTFLHDDFLLTTASAKRLYHEVAAKQPIIDYHNHLPPKEIAGNRQFDNLTQVWLAGDHYKWRAMRALGVDEYYITGNASDEEKFLKWAECVPHTLRNPQYHWTHLELKRYFGIDELLSASNAHEVYAHCNRQLQHPSFGVRGLLESRKVEVVCTTDDPLDDLIWHRSHAKTNPSIRMYPAFRPDKAMKVWDGPAFRAYVAQATQMAGHPLDELSDYLGFLSQRHDFFHSHGCRLSDHGLERIHFVDTNEKRAAKTYGKLLMNDAVSKDDLKQLEGYLLWIFGTWDQAKGWAQQFHLGALRNTNSRGLSALGPDSGYDSMGDFSQARGLAGLLDALDSTEQLPKTIVYNLNPADNALFATMMGNFNDGKIRGKMQFGSGWWFLDQLDGMTQQLNTLSTMGLLSTFVGMLTDSRSFLSFPRHEYFRRLLCQLIGQDIENGLLPDDPAMIEPLITNVCYHNAKNYFQFPE